MWGVFVVAGLARMSACFVCEGFFGGWMLFLDFGFNFSGEGGVFGRGFGIFDFLIRLGGFSDGGFIIMN